MQGRYDENSEMRIWADKEMFGFKSSAKFWLKARKTSIEIEALDAGIFLEEK